MTAPDAKAKATALNATAMDHLRRGDFRSAREVLSEAIVIDPSHLGAWTNLAGVQRRLGDIAGALSSIQSALKVEPRAFFPLFLRGSIFEQGGDEKAAAHAYGIALQVAPPPAARDEPTRQGLAAAEALIARVNARKAEFLEGTLAGTVSGLSPAERTRAEILLGNLTGQRRPYRQEPLVFDFPQLPAIEFWDRSEFAWLEAVEAATPAIQEELRGALATQAADLKPYIHYGEGLPLDQWAELNHNPDWSGYHLIEAGVPVPEHAAACPRTMQALALADQPDMPGRSPVALFSVLQPKTRIPPHTGASNARLLCHLPLIVPPDCHYRVGGTWRGWSVGEGFVFDDTIEHEARNDSDQVRVVLIFDIWNPRLTPADRALISATMGALDAWNGTAGQRADWT